MTPDYFGFTYAMTYSSRHVHELLSIAESSDSSASRSSRSSSSDSSRSSSSDSSSSEERDHPAYGINHFIPYTYSWRIYSFLCMLTTWSMYFFIAPSNYDFPSAPFDDEYYGE